MIRLLWLISIVTLISACSQTAEKKPRALPFAGNFDVVTYEEDGEVFVDSVYPKIPSFQYLNQDSVMIPSESMKGKIWIANFFFTSCPSICPPMISQMKRLNILTADISPYLQFMSFSIDPSHDKPHVLKKYIRNNGINTANWQFFTGDEAETHRLGVEHFMVHAEQSDMAPGGYAHSEGVVLVDREGYVRGIYLGTQTKEIDRLHKDIRKLLAIEYGINSKQK